MQRLSDHLCLDKRRIVRKWDALISSGRERFIARIVCDTNVWITSAVHRGSRGGCWHKDDSGRLRRLPHVA